MLSEVANQTRQETIEKVVNADTLNDSRPMSNMNTADNNGTLGPHTFSLLFIYIFMLALLAFLLSAIIFFYPK